MLYAAAPGTGRIVASTTRAIGSFSTDAAAAARGKARVDGREGRGRTERDRRPTTPTRGVDGGGEWLATRTY